MTDDVRLTQADHDAIWGEGVPSGYEWIADAAPTPAKYGHYTHAIFRRISDGQHFHHAIRYDSGGADPFEYMTPVYASASTATVWSTTPGVLPETAHLMGDEW